MFVRGSIALQYDYDGGKACFCYAYAVLFANARWCVRASRVFTRFSLLDRYSVSTMEGREGMLCFAMRFLFANTRLLCARVATVLFVFEPRVHRVSTRPLRIRARSALRAPENRRISCALDARGSRGPRYVHDRDCAEA